MGKGLIITAAVLVFLFISIVAYFFLFEKEESPNLENENPSGVQITIDNSTEIITPINDTNTTLSNTTEPEINTTLITTINESQKLLPLSSFNTHDCGTVTDTVLSQTDLELFLNENPLVEGSLKCGGSRLLNCNPFRILFRSTNNPDITFAARESTSDSCILEHTKENDKTIICQYSKATIRKTHTFNNSDNITIEDNLKDSTLLHSIAIELGSLSINEGKQLKLHNDSTICDAYSYFEGIGQRVWSDSTSQETIDCGEVTSKSIGESKIDPEIFFTNNPDLQKSFLCSTESVLDCTPSTLKYILADGQSFETFTAKGYDGTECKFSLSSSTVIGQITRTKKTIECDFKQEHISISNEDEKFSVPREKEAISMEIYKFLSNKLPSATNGTITVDFKTLDSQEKVKIGCTVS